MNQRAGQDRGKADPRKPAVSEASQQVDRSGEAILALLRQAAETAQADCDRAMQAAHQYSMQLRASEDRAEKLQAQVERLEQQAALAATWLARIKGEIEDRFLQPPAAETRR